MKFEYNKAFAQQQDANDTLAKFRDKFYIPKQKNGTDSIYCCGNSLGLQPKSVTHFIDEELKSWKEQGVEGHFEGKKPWLSYHELLTKQMSNLVGAKPMEVVVMNTLSVNLHLMLVSFYQPTPKRYKILIEADAFPSDLYAVISQLKFHGFDEKALIKWYPEKNNDYYNINDFKSIMDTQGEEIALVLIGCPNYYNGQVFPLKNITKIAHSKGANVGFDLAHAVGNIKLNLHDTNVDFAVWCTYKYLNSGPGSLAGCFVHERHSKNKNLPRFAGWWGHQKETRFNMRQEFEPTIGAEGWQLSNPPILSMAAIRASLQIFEEANFEKLLEKSKNLTAYLAFLLDNLGNDQIEVITPKNPEERGCQLSVKLKKADKSLFEKITNAGVIADWREPNVIRFAPVPLYNTYTDVYELVEILKKQL